MSDKALEAIRLDYAFGTVEVLRGLTFSVQRNEFVAIVGPSGCGKTTLLSLLSGYEQPLSGEVIRHGTVRTVFQRDGLFPWLTCAENIRLGLRSVRPMNEQVGELLSLIRLNGFADKYPHQLSGGMRQLVEVARAMAGKTDILLMDEPFSALDYLTRLRMRGDLLRLLQDRPRTVVFVTHDIEEACQLADRVLVLSPRPARVSLELRIDVPRPRGISQPKVAHCMHRIFQEFGISQHATVVKEASRADLDGSDACPRNLDSGSLVASARREY